MNITLSTIEVVEPNKRIGWTGTAIDTQAGHIWTRKPHKDGPLLTAEESMAGRQDNKMEMKRRRHG